MVIKMNNVYLHFKKNNLNILYLISIILLVIYGFYKNGILIYNELNGNIINLFRPITFSIFSVIPAFIFQFIKNRKMSIDNNIIYILIFSLCVPINMNIGIYFIYSIIVNLLLYFVIPKYSLNINYISLFKIIIIILLKIIKQYEYANSLEKISKYSYNLLDIFFGRGISGVCCSSIFLILISYAIFTSNSYYKKEIPVISISVYFIISLALKLLLGKVIIINSLIIYSLIFIAPISSMSPVGMKERKIYSLVLGILTFIFTYYFSQFDGVIYAIFISSFINYLNLN